MGTCCDPNVQTGCGEPSAEADFASYIFSFTLWVSWVLNFQLSILFHPTQTRYHSQEEYRLSGWLTLQKTLDCIEDLTKNKKASGATHMV